jgi:hypothetical protein
MALFSVESIVGREPFRAHLGGHVLSRYNTSINQLPSARI